MSFGKRKVPPGGGQARLGTLAGPAPSATMPIVERLESLRIVMDRCLTQAAELAGMIERVEMLDASRFGPQFRHSQYPIDISDLAALFTTGSGKDKLNSVYAYTYPTGSGASDIAAALQAHDASAQLDLLGLASGIVRVNTTCQAGHRDGALGVAVQSPAMRAAVDGVIVGAAFFSAFFANMGTAQPVFSGGSAMAEGAVDLAGMRSVLDRRLAIARSAVLEPSRFDALVPNARWPLIGLELGCFDHEGQRFLDEVYLPKELADAAVAMRAESPPAAAAAE